MMDPNLPTREDYEALFVNDPEVDRVAAYLNRFNPIRVMRMEGMEIRHSAILAWLLNPRESHGFGEEFLRTFLAAALRADEQRRSPSALDISLADLRDAEIHIERSNVDVLITSAANAWVFIVENKFHSKQRGGQLRTYIDRAKKEAEAADKKLAHRGIFLTLHGEQPAEEAKSDYVTLSYGAVCQALERVAENNVRRLSSETQLFIAHYIEIISEACGMSQDLNDMAVLAKQLYRRHRKVLEFVMDHGATSDFIAAAESLFGENLEAGQEFSSEGADQKFVFHANTDRRFAFLPVSWREALGGTNDLHLWKGCEGWWSKFPVQCWFELSKEENGVSAVLRLFAEVGPLSDANLRRSLIDCINSEGIRNVKFGVVATGEAAKYSKFLNAKEYSKKIVDRSDAGEISRGISALLGGFKETANGVASALRKFRNEVGHGA